MANGDLKKKLAKKEWTFTLDDQEFNYLKNLEKTKEALTGAIDVYISNAQMGFLNYLGSHKFGLNQGKQYQFDVDIDSDSDKRVSVKEV